MVLLLEALAPPPSKAAGTLGPEGVRIPDFTAVGSGARGFAG